MFAALCVEDRSSIEALVALARDFTPRWERRGPSAVLLDLAGLERLFGHPRAIAEALQRAAGERGVRTSIAIAGTCTAAQLLACSRPPAAGSRQQEPLHPSLPTAGRRLPTSPIVIPCGEEAAALAPLPLDRLPVVANVNDPNDPNDPNGPNPSSDPNDLLSTSRRWGIRTLGAMAALPSDAVAARLGAGGVRWQRLARGEDLRPLMPEAPEERFEQAIDLDWPIDGAEPLAFVLGRLLEPLAAHLERRGRGAAVLRLRLHLVTRAVHERVLQLPAPMREARTLRTLLLLDLESHPPGAAIDRVVVAVEPTPARVLQFSLLTRPLPSPERLSTLLARVTALVGEGRCGSPALVDSWQPGAFAMRPFGPDPNPKSQIPNPKSEMCVALRRFRMPITARVRVDDERPVSVSTYRRELPGGSVRRAAGPWRTSGHWWAQGKSQIPNAKSQQHNLCWDRDEWDVTLGDGTTCRVFRDRATGGWFVEGVYD